MVIFVKDAYLGGVGDETERRLRDLEERFRTLVDGSPDIVFVTDASSRMIYANAALFEQTGYTVDDFQMPQEENHFIHADDRAHVAAFLTEFVASGRKYSGPLKNRFVARDGRVLWYSSVISRGESEGAPVLQFVLHNTTEQELARMELARVQEQLIKSERLAAIGELAAIVAHEIRNPLSIIYNALTTLRKEPSQIDANALLIILSDEAGRLQRTVRDLLDFTRPMTPAFETCDLADIARDALAAVESERDESVRVSRTLGGPHLADVDHDMIHRAIVNIVGNAFQAMPNGGDLELAFDRNQEAGTIALSIRDSGAGIPAEAESRLFEPFFTTRPTGTGLGLALVKRMVEAHHGEVRAIPSPKGGACFTITLPITQATSATP